MPGLRATLRPTAPRTSLRAVLREEFLVRDSRISLREQLDRVHWYDNAIIFVHGVHNGPGWSAGNMARELKDRWPEAFDNSLIGQLYWGAALFPHWSSSIGDRTDQVYGLTNLGWSGTAKLADAIGRIQDVLGPEVPVAVMVHSQGCAVTLAALQEGLRFSNLVMMGSPLDMAIVDGRKNNTRVLDAIEGVAGEMINCSSFEDGISTAGAFASAIGGSGGAGLSIGRAGLPGSVLRHPRVHGLMLTKVDHNEENGWWAAKWIDPDYDPWRGLDPTDFARILSSRNQAPGAVPVLPRQQEELEAHLKYIHTDPRRGWAAVPNMVDKNAEGFSSTVYVPAFSTVRWHFDDKDDARYRISVTKGRLRARLLEAEWYRFNRKTAWKTLTPADGLVQETLETTGINDATYALEIQNPDASPAVAELTFGAWDR